MEELILKWGAVAGAISAVIALTWRILKPVNDRRKKERSELKAYRAGVAEAIKRIEDKLDAQEEDLAFTQRYDLKMAHAQ